MSDHDPRLLRRIACAGLVLLLLAFAMAAAPLPSPLPSPPLRAAR